jgi:hypothetical protein
VEGVDGQLVDMDRMDCHIEDMILLYMAAPIAVVIYLVLVNLGLACAT